MQTPGIMRRKSQIEIDIYIIYEQGNSRNVRNSIKCEKNITPPPPPPFEIQNQNQGIEDIMDIDSNCPSLLFGETTAHLTSK